jgi:nitrogen regulatory protein PII
MQMIIFVLNDPGHLDQVLNAWQKAGVKGVTLIETSGFYRRQKKHVPMRYFFGSSGAQEEGNMTLMAIVADQATVDQCLVATETVVGDLDQPNTGIFAAFPLSTVKGLNKIYR